MTKLTLAICASATFYHKVIPFSRELETLGFDVVLPHMAEQMKREGRENEEISIDWSKHPGGYAYKSELIRGHFDEIAKSDAILVVNYEKHNKQNYIGPNVLMEMAVAFHLHKKIYVLNGIPEDSPLIDEILALQPVFLNGNLSLIGS